MSRLLQLSIFLLLLSNGIAAQDDADSLKLSSFRKGRNLDIQENIFLLIL
jgi:hypothetical protein